MYKRRRMDCHFAAHNKALSVQVNLDADMLPYLAEGLAYR